MQSDLTRTQRLDRLPYTRKHNTMLFASGVGWALDAMDVGLIAYIMLALTKEWSLTGAEQSVLASVGFIGMALGASLGGLLADRIGRRRVFALTLLVYGIATGLSALSTGLVALIVLRFVVGLGLGGELPVASTLVSEFSPQRIRGRVVVALESFWAVGWLGAALVGYFVVPLENGWRWALAFGLIPALWSLVIRAKVPESVRFLESKGRHEEAEAIVADWESAAGVQARAGSGDPGPLKIENGSEGAETERIGWRELFEPRFRQRTIALWLVWFGVNFAYYGAFIWIPTLLHQGGLTVVKSFEFTLFMTLAQLPGYLVAAILIEVWGRRATLVSFLGGSALAAVGFGFAGQLADSIAPGSGAWQYGVAMFFGCLLSFFNLGAWGAVYAITPEVYPTTGRASGAGAATAFGRIAAMVAPMVVPLVAPLGLGILFGLFGGMFALAMVAGWFLPEHKGLALEER